MLLNVSLDALTIVVGRNEIEFSISVHGTSEGQSEIFCYDCHEELLHNPILLPEDISRLATIVKKRGLDETNKPNTREKLAGRIKLLHEIISHGLQVIEKE